MAGEGLRGRVGADAWRDWLKFRRSTFCRDLTLLGLAVGSGDHKQESIGHPCFCGPGLFGTSGRCLRIRNVHAQNCTAAIERLDNAMLRRHKTCWYCGHRCCWCCAVALQLGFATVFCSFFRPRNTRDVCSTAVRSTHSTQYYCFRSTHTSL